jgi:general stress protein 26
MRMHIEGQPSYPLQELANLIAQLRVGMLTTVDHEGCLHSRPLTTLKMDSDSALWFLISISSQKVGDLDNFASIGLCYGNGEGTYISISGTTQIVRERAIIQELWTSLAKSWFPGDADDPDLAALKVQVQRAEYWHGPASRFVQLYAIAKATVTGDSGALGTHRKVSGD